MKKEIIVNNAKEEFLIRHKKKVKIAVGLVLFVVGFVLSFNFFNQPIPNEQFSLCEQVAQDIAMKLPSNVTSGSLSIDVTDDFSVDVVIKENSVEVTPSYYFALPDTAIAQFNDGALVSKQRDNFPVVILVSVLIGLVCFIVGSLLVTLQYIDVTKKTSE